MLGTLRLPFLFLYISILSTIFLLYEMGGLVGGGGGSGYIGY